MKKGTKMTTESIEKIRKSKLGKKFPNLSNALKGHRHSQETRKKMSDARKGRFKGINSPGWRGGKSFEPYNIEFNEDLKEVIRNRDRRKCQLCEKTELENRQKLDVHHIDYNKHNCNLNNLISLCRYCHAKTNNNREYWKKYFNC